MKDKLEAILGGVLVLGFAFGLPAYSILREWWMWSGTKFGSPYIDLAAYAIIGVVIMAIVIAVKVWIEMWRERKP